MLWHYATHNTVKSNLKFGHTLDPSNPSLNLQVKKFETRRNISVSNMIPIRDEARAPKWEQRFGGKNGRNC